MIKNVLFKAGLTAVTMAMLLSSAASVQAAEKMKSSKEVVSEMGIGWNLGNTLDCTAPTPWFDVNDPVEWEKCWGNPKTSKEMIDKVKEAGFTTVRIPTTWGYHMGAAPAYTINAGWMARVQEVVDYAIDDGMYVILNAHHEDNWCIPTKAKEAECSAQLKSLWTQVANNFKDYDSHLIFEVQNEPRYVGSPEEWSGGTAEGRQVVNDYNEVGLDAIRATGGNNAERSVMIPTYGAAAYGNTLDAYKVLDDKNIIGSIHSYSPYDFCLDTSSGRTTWGTDAEVKALEDELNFDYEAFQKKGIPVVIGEFGSRDKNQEASRIKNAEVYARFCASHGIPCCWWDDNYNNQNMGQTCGLLNRQTVEWQYPAVKDALIKTYNENNIYKQVPLLLGDINGDGVINVADYSLFRKYFNAGPDNNIKIHKENADVNKDGAVDFFDLVALKALI